jgi:hypothetical protein
LAWQCGIPPGELVSIDFRCKIEGRPANRYGIEVAGQRTGEAATMRRPVDALYGSNWGYGFFKYTACDYCDDVVGETADASIGDAWLPQYVGDARGNNIVVVRRKELRDLIEKALSEGRLRLDRVTADEIAESQAGALRHRREGLAYRLYMADQKVVWRPRKRVKASCSHLSRRERAIHGMRMDLAARSHTAFEEAVRRDDFDVFRQLMKPHLQAYDALYRRPFWRRIGGKVRTAGRRLMAREWHKSRGVSS